MSRRPTTGAVLAIAVLSGGLALRVYSQATDQSNQKPSAIHEPPSSSQNQSDRAVKDPGETGQSRQEAQNSPVILPFVYPGPVNDPDAYKISSTVEMVLLDVSVKDSKGGFVSGLSKEQFHVMDNGKPQEIKTFEAGDIPVTVGLVVDNSGSMRPKRADVVTSALTFVQQSNPKDEMFVVNFNDSVKMGLPRSLNFSDDHTQLRNALLSNPTQGRTALNDALKVALLHLEKGRRDKKTLVLISDGGDNASDTTQGDAIRLAEESRATVYTIGIFDTGDRDKNPGFLKHLAAVTGGEAFFPESLNGLVGVCEKIAKDIRNRYSIGYLPSERATDAKPRKIRVTASTGDKGRLIVRTRTEYIPAAFSKPLSAAAKTENKKGARNK
jgi:VWFA-related protein